MKSKHKHLAFVFFILNVLITFHMYVGIGFTYAEFNVFRWETSMRGAIVWWPLIISVAATFFYAMLLDLSGD